MLRGATGLKTVVQAAACLIQRGNAFTDAAILALETTRDLPGSMNLVHERKM